MIKFFEVICKFVNELNLFLHTFLKHYKLIFNSILKDVSI